MRRKADEFLSDAPAAVARRAGGCARTLYSELGRVWGTGAAEAEVFPRESLFFVSVITYPGKLRSKKQ